ncbi:NUDIX hydrolase, partial [Aeromicrobium sp.]|uniref:NUDIX hydrolase n=1 Tax=Aeromicrobium sp. TaxID=1871063 RepID=UPI003C634B93
LESPREATWPASNGYRMKLFYVTISDGDPTTNDGHDAVRWLSHDELGEVEWLHSDREALVHLKVSELSHPPEMPSELP